MTEYQEIQRKNFGHFDLDCGVICIQCVALLRACFVILLTVSHAISRYLFLILTAFWKVCLT